MIDQDEIALLNSLRVEFISTTQDDLDTCETLALRYEKDHNKPDLISLKGQYIRSRDLLAHVNLLVLLDYATNWKQKLWRLNPQIRAGDL